jgi:hypothetical protein
VLTFVIRSAHHTGDEITRRLGLEPTDVLERGAPISRHSRKRRPDTFWGLDADLPEPSAEFAALLPVVEARQTVVDELRAEGATLFWSCMVTAKPTGNQFVLEPDILTRLAAIGAPLDFDLYNSD